MAAQSVQCQLCPRHCRLKNGERGFCRVRINIDGKLQTLVYGNPCSINIDPIEKKPFYHVLPGSGTFSLATAGCNLRCKYCQNWQISQYPPEDLQNYKLSPEEIVHDALKNKCQSIAYTYTDPVIFYEYVLDTAKIARKNGLLNILVSAGYIEQAPLIELCENVDAIKIDFKGITEEFYRDMCSATLKPVLEAITTIKKQDVWLELTNLVVPTWNDDEKDLRALCRWTIDNVGTNVPMHFSRFWPTHQLKNLPPTPEKTIIRARQIALDEGIFFAYTGNIMDNEGNNTYCPNDKKLLVRRQGYLVLENNIVDGKCKFCQTKIPGIWL
ncbi:MAG TPA: AmmeMemoRadiSam system radical SAM enzyme [Candidatus Omnitrophota bacterium]|nr:AmmeMemoRadiSam system radical SAM enzyme [Candidatus Omnitrophota bacterium]HPN88100.1 AmmeMemoRadiSam system radical SAM enzyme [Candidatus Omnitrophota bacterium]